MAATSQTNLSVAKTKGQLLDQAATQLFHAIKKHTKGRALSRSDLAKQGYSRRFIDKFERA